MNNISNYEAHRRDEEFDRVADERAAAREADPYGPNPPDHIVGAPCDGGCCVPSDNLTIEPAGDAFAAQDAHHPPPDWMADQEAVRQAREEMEEAALARAEQHDLAHSQVKRSKHHLWVALEAYRHFPTPTNTCILAQQAEQLVEALDRLEEIENP